MITKLKLFVESKLGNVVTIFGNNNIKILDKKDFDNDELIKEIKLENFGDKIIHIKWNHTDKHNIKNKIRDRSQIFNVSEFNDIFTKTIIDLFDNQFNNIKRGTDEYDIRLNDSNLDILTVLKYDDLFKNYTQIFIITVLPQPDFSKEILEFPY